MKDQVQTFVALKSADQTYHHFKLNHMNTNDLVPIGQECVESTLNVKYSPEAINPSNINSELFKEGKIVDEFIMEFSLAFMVLGFEYMYKIAPVDVTAVSYTHLTLPTILLV